MQKIKILLVAYASCKEMLLTCCIYDHYFIENSTT